MNFLEGRSEYRTWRAKYGTSICDRVIREDNRRRLENPDREKRKSLSPPRRRDLYARQSGRCAECQDPFPIEKLEADHKDPNRQDFNARSNWQLLCRPCHAEKAAKSVMEQTKFYGRTAKEILER